MFEFRRSVSALKYLKENQTRVYRLSSAQDAHFNITPFANLHKTQDRGDVKIHFK